MLKVLRNNKLEALRYWKETLHVISYTSWVANELGEFASRDKNLKVIVDDVNFKQGAADTSSERIESELKELHRRHVKLECHSRRGNMKLFGIK